MPLYPKPRPKTGADDVEEARFSRFAMMVGNYVQ